MTAYVVDASVVVEVLLHTTLGRQATATLLEADTLESPILPGFTCQVGRFFPVAA